MLVKYFDGEIKPEFKVENPIETEVVKERVKSHFDKFEIQEAAMEIIELVDKTNKYVTEKAPWTLAKEGKMEECGQVLTNVLEVMSVVSKLIYPYCPNIAEKMSKQLKIDLSKKLDEVDEIKVGKLISKEEIQPVFLRLDSEFATNKK